MSTQWPATLASYCHRLTKSQIDADDLVSQTLLQALPVVTGAAAHPNPEAYLRQIAKHLWIDYQRSAKRREHPVDGQTLESLRLTNADASAGVGANEATGDPLATQLATVDIEAALHVLLSALTPLERTALLLHDVYMLTAKETAERLHSTESAVKAALRRGRGKLRERRQLRGRREDGELRDGRQPEDGELRENGKLRGSANGLGAGGSDATSERAAAGRSGSDLAASEIGVQKDLLTAYLAAFRRYDIAALVQLGQIDTLDLAYTTSQAVHLAQARAQARRASSTSARGHNATRCAA